MCTVDEAEGVGAIFNGCRALVVRNTHPHLFHSSGFRVQGSGSRVQGPGSRVQIQGAGFRV